MKNVTITVEDKVLDWARVEAARRNTSVSRMLGEILGEKMRHDDAYQRAYEEWKADRARFDSAGQPAPARDALYERGPGGA